MAVAVSATALAVPVAPAGAAQIVHVPVAAAAFRAEVPIDATVDCTNPDCGATLYFRTTDPTATDDTLASYTAVAMTMTPETAASGHYIVQAHGTIPSSSTDTRGVDYLFSVLDGATTSWFPGVESSAGAALGPLDVTVSQDSPIPQHVHVIDPVHGTHTPVAVSYLHEPITATIRATCSTGTCAAALHYRTSTGLDTLTGTNQYLSAGLAGEGFTVAAMTGTVVQDLGSGQQVVEFTAEVPGSVVDTNGVDYVLAVTDAYTTAYSPGTSYVGAGLAADGQATGWHHVEVLSRPQVVHVPPAYYVPGVALQLSAEVTSATGFPTVTLRYRAGSDLGLLSTAMTVRETPVRRPEGTVYIATGAIPGATTAAGGLMVYGFAVDDGYQTTYNPATAGFLDTNLGYVVAVENPTPL